MKKLIPMTDFVLEQREHQNKIDSNVLTVIYNYANFIKQPNELWMFVPCDKDGNILEDCAVTNEDEQYYHFLYEQAKERCLFEGFEVIEDKYYHTKREIIYLPNTQIQVWRKLTYHNGEVETFFFDYYNEFKTVEDLLKYNLQLTQTAINQIGL